MNAQDNDAELERFGRSVKIDIDKFFKDWNSFLAFGRVFTKYSATSKKLGIGVSEFADELEKRQFIKLFTTPSNKRYVISTECTWEPEQIIEHIMQLEEK